MTHAGTITIGVDIDANDLGAKLAAQVRKALGPMQAQVQKDLAKTNTAIKDLDSGGFVQVAKEATKAADATEGLAGAARDAAKASETATKSQTKQSTQTDKLTTSTNKLKAAQDDYNSAIGLFGPKSDEAIAAQKRLVKAHDSHTAAIIRNNSEASRASRDQIADHERVAISAERSARRQIAAARQAEDADRFLRALRAGSRGGGGGGGGGVNVPGVPGGGIGGVGLAAAGVGIVGSLPALTTVTADLAQTLQTVAQSGLVLPGLLAAVGSSALTAKLGFSNLGDAITAVNKASDGTPKSIKAAQAALAGFGPETQNLIGTIVGIQGKFDDLRKDVQEHMFAGLSHEIDDVVNTQLPTLKHGLEGIGDAWADTFKRLGEIGKSPFVTNLLDSILGDTKQFQLDLNNALEPLTHGLGELFKGSADTGLPRISEDINKVANEFNDWITKASSDGRLATWINKGVDGLEHIGNSVLNIANSFSTLADAAPDNLLAGLDSLTGKLDNWLSSADGQQKLHDFIAQGTHQLQLLGDTFSNLWPLLKSGMGGAIDTVGVLEETFHVITVAINAAQTAWAAFGSSFPGTATVIQKSLQGVLNPLQGLKEALDILNAQTAKEQAGQNLRDAQVAAGFGPPGGTTGRDFFGLPHTGGGLTPNVGNLLQPDVPLPSQPKVTPPDLGANLAAANIPGAAQSSQAAIEQLQQMIKNLPDVTITVNVNTANAARQIQAFISAVNSQSANIRINAITPGNAPSLGSGKDYFNTKAGGGPIWGPGTSTSDSIPILASTGEYMLSARDVAKLGGAQGVDRFRSALHGYWGGGGIRDLPPWLLKKLASFGNFDPRSMIDTSMVWNRPVDKMLLGETGVNIPLRPGDPADWWVNWLGLEGDLISGKGPGFSGHGRGWQPPYDRGWARGGAIRGYDSGGAIAQMPPWLWDLIALRDPRGTAGTNPNDTPYGPGPFGPHWDNTGKWSQHALGPTPINGPPGKYWETGPTKGSAPGGRTPRWMFPDPTKPFVPFAPGWDNEKIRAWLMATGGWGGGGWAGGGAIFDTGGLQSSGQIGFNLSGSPERVLSPEQTVAFESLVNNLGAPGTNPVVGLLGEIRDSINALLGAVTGTTNSVDAGTQGAVAPFGAAVPTGLNIGGSTGFNTARKGGKGSGSSGWIDAFGPGTGTNGWADVFGPGTGTNMPPTAPGLPGTDIATGSSPIPVWVVGTGPLGTTGAAGDQSGLTGVAGSALAGIGGAAGNVAGDIATAVVSSNQTLPKRIVDAQTLARQGNPLTIAGATGFNVPDLTRQGGGPDAQNIMANDQKFTAGGQMFSDTAALLDRTFTSMEAANQARQEQLLTALNEIRDKLGKDVLGPIVQDAVKEGFSAISNAVQQGIGSNLGVAAAPPIASAVGSAVASASASSSPSGGLAGTAGGVVSSALNVFGGTGFNLGGAEGGGIFGGIRGVDSVPALLQHGEHILTTSDVRAMGGQAGVYAFRAGLSRLPHFATGGGVIGNDTVGADFFGVSQIPLIGTIVNMLVSILLKVIGVNVEVRDTLDEISKDFKDFRGDFKAFDASGRLRNDTSGLVDRSKSSEQTAVDERLRILKQVLIGLVKYIIEKVIVPITKAVLSALVQAGASAAGGALGVVPGGSAASGIVTSLISSAGDAGVQVLGDVIGSSASAGSGVFIDSATNILGSFFNDALTPLLSGGVEGVAASPGGLGGTASSVLSGIFGAGPGGGGIPGLLSGLVGGLTGSDGSGGIFGILSGLLSGGLLGGAGGAGGLGGILSGLLGGGLLGGSTSGVAGAGGGITSMFTNLLSGLFGSVLGSDSGIAGTGGVFQGLFGGALGSLFGGASAPGSPVSGIFNGLFGGLLGGLFNGFGGILSTLFGGASGGLGSILGGFMSALGLATFDEGGMAYGTGLMAKATIAPERVLNPGETGSLARLEAVMAGGHFGTNRNTTIHAPITVMGGRDAAERTRDHLMTLMS